MIMILILTPSDPAWNDYHSHSHSYPNNDNDSHSPLNRPIVTDCFNRLADPGRGVLGVYY
jgi:hypothetical protein